MIDQISPSNRKVGSIEHVGDDGFIVEAVDPTDPNFHGGKRLFKNYDDLLRFLAEYLEIHKSTGNMYGVKKPSRDQGSPQHETGEPQDALLAGGNGESVYPQHKDCPTRPQQIRTVGEML